MAEFNWVRARAECSLARCFERLHAGVKGDVEARNEIARALQEGIVFETARPSGARIMVTRSGNPIRRVDLVLTQDAILAEQRVQEQNDVTFRATPGLNNPCDCTLMIDGSELELWQVRRLALEKLFFADLQTISRVAVK